MRDKVGHSCVYLIILCSGKKLSDILGSEHGVYLRKDVDYNLFPSL